MENVGLTSDVSLFDCHLHGSLRNSLDCLSNHRLKPYRRNIDWGNCVLQQGGEQLEGDREPGGHLAATIGNRICSPPVVNIVNNMIILPHVVITSGYVVLCVNIVNILIL